MISLHALVDRVLFFFEGYNNYLWYGQFKVKTEKVGNWYPDKVK